MTQSAMLLSQLAAKSQKLSPNQRVLAKHILDNYQAVAFSTVRQLSRDSGVSEATIVRFAKALDFAGYPQLQKEIRRIVRADLKGTDRFKLAYAVRESAPHGPLSAIIAKEIENISVLQQTLDLKTFRQAVAALRQSPEIVVVGTRSSAPLAHHLWFGLSKIEIRATRHLHITTETYDQLARLGSSACLVVIGFPRYLRELVDLLAFARRRKIRTLTITDSPFSALRGDISLHAPAESATFVAAHCASLVLVNGLLHEVSAADKPRTLSALNRFEALAEAQAYFHAA